MNTYKQTDIKTGIVTEVTAEVVENELERYAYTTWGDDAPEAGESDMGTVMEIQGEMNLAEVGAKFETDRFTFTKIG